MKKIVLASKSPRRKEILEGAGVNFDIVVSNADESLITKKIEPQMYVSQLAMLKACDAAKTLHGNYFVIGSDTIVEYKGEFLGKPKDRDDAYRMIKELSGNVHRVYSGICIFDTKTGRAETDFECTRVYFKNLSEDEILDYISTDEPYDKAYGPIWNTDKPRYYWEGKAGAYGIQDPFGMRVVERIEGDYYNVVGLPISKLIQMFKEKFNIEL